MFHFVGAPFYSIDFRQINCTEIGAAILPAADNEKKGTCFLQAPFSFTYPY